VSEGGREGGSVGGWGEKNGEFERVRLSYDSRGSDK
jgi:hypothetical protein